LLKFQPGSGAVTQVTVNAASHSYIAGIRKDASTGKIYLWALRSGDLPMEYVSSDDGATWDGGTNMGGPNFNASRMQGQMESWWRNAALILLHGPEDKAYLYKRTF
jgi:hypothetical protein